jgi:transposase-like protein
MLHCSTVEERIQMVAHMIATPTYGLITHLSREHHISRQSLYRWKEQAMHVLKGTWGSPVEAREKDVCQIFRDAMRCKK